MAVTLIAKLMSSMDWKIDVILPLVKGSYKIIHNACWLNIQGSTREILLYLYFESLLAVFPLMYWLYLEF